MTEREKKHKAKKWPLLIRTKVDIFPLKIFLQPEEILEQDYLLLIEGPTVSSYGWAGLGWDVSVEKLERVSYKEN